MAEPISLRFPFKRTQGGGVFQSTKNTAEAIRSDLISLLTTKRGHRVMRPNLYSPIYDFIMEPWDDISEDELREELIEKIEQFMGNLVEVKKVDLEIQDDGNTLLVRVVYLNLQIAGITDSIQLFVPLEHDHH